MNLGSKIQELSAPQDAARSAGLRHVTDQMPGIRRVRAGQGFRYAYPTGDTVKDEEVLKRIRSLAIPPAWQETWICPDPCGHLQATGRDQRGRKQSRYHPRWREVRDENKYARMIAFGKALPKIRRQVKRDLNRPGLPREKVLAAVVRLLEISLIRVGNEEYARQNDSFGLTTMRDRHVRISKGKLRFHFRGKSGKWHEVDIRDQRLARIVRACQDLPGQELFQYIDDDGQQRTIGSEDVNAYIHEIVGGDFTAKDFRTWAGTVLAARALKEFQKFDSKAQAKKNILRAIEMVASRLGNTVSVCRKCYIHPEVLDGYLEGALVDTVRQRAERQLAESLSRLPPEEAAVLAFLQQRLRTAGTRLQDQLKASLSLQKRSARQRRPKSEERRLAA